MSPAAYAAYERIRRKRGGVAVAAVVEGLCTVCHMVLRPQFYQDVRRNEEVLYCESCGRILYYSPARGRRRGRARSECVKLKFSSPFPPGRPSQAGDRKPTSGVTQ